MAFQFITNIKNGFMAANETRKIVFSDPALFLYPIIAALLDILIFAGFAVLAIISAAVTDSFLAAIVVFFVAYVLVVFVAVYFLVAMLLAFREFANGKKISLGEGLSRASAYTAQILEWVIFISIIKVLLDILEILIQAALRRFGMIGNIIGNLITAGLNLALAIVTLFAIPVIIDEKTGPFETLKRSAKFIIKAWGETFGGFVYSEIIYFILLAIGILFFFAAAIQIISISAIIANPILIVYLLIALVIMFALALNPAGAGILFIIFVAAAFIAPSGATIGALILVSIGGIMMIAAHLIRYVLFNCFRLIVYDYKTRGVLPKNFDKKVIDSSVQWKGGQQGGQGGSKPLGGLFQT